MVTPVGLRLPDITVAKVRQLAAMEQRSYAEMVCVLTEEAIKMRGFQRRAIGDLVRALEAFAQARSSLANLYLPLARLIGQ